MKAYLGPLGSMVALPYISSEQIDSSRDSTERLTLGGHLRVQVARARRRSWKVTIGAMRPNELGELAELLEVGRPPWVWVEPWAQVTNLLTPRQSVLAAGSFQGTGDLGGRVQLADDLWSRWSLVPGGWLDIGIGTPVDPGRPVSASVWLTGTRAKVSLVWQHLDGSYEESREVVATAKKPRRVAIVGRPKSTVRSVALRIKDATLVARPAITWTPAPVEWHMGQGCTSAIVTDLPQDIVAAFRNRHGLRSANTSFTVSEVM